MEAGEARVYLFSACAVATLLWHPASPVRQYLSSDAVRRILMGSAMGATIIAIVLSPWGKQTSAHFNLAVTLTFYRLGKVAFWDAAFYYAARLVGALSGVALASFVLHGAPAHKAVHYAATIPGVYGDAVAFAAELVISLLLMIGSYWRALWIYFTAPPLGMLAAAEVFLFVGQGNGPHCAKLHHENDKRCIFRHSAAVATSGHA